MTIHVTRKTARLLNVLLVIHKLRKLSEEVGTTYHMSSREIMERANVGSGSFYPIMSRLETHGWVAWEWEIVPQGENRPRRLYYHLTEPGAIAARSAIKQDDNRITLWDRIMKGLAK